MEFAKITPVQYHEGLFYKRDDLYQPFGPYHVNGGKVRQGFKLFETMLDEIKGKYDNGVVTAASVYSPQSANIAKIAQHFGVECISTVGGTKPELLYNHHMMELTRYYGSDIRIVAGTGMSGPVHSRMKKLAKELNYLPIEMGELLHVNPQAIFETTANQVQNLPDSIDNLIVPVGVAIQLCGILIGLKRYQISVKNIFAVCVGPTREKKLESYFKDVYNANVYDYDHVTWVASSEPYAKEYHFNILDDEMDDIYEGKAFNWYKKFLHPKMSNDVFWCVGKRPTRKEVNHIIQEGI